MASSGWPSRWRSCRRHNKGGTDENAGGAGPCGDGEWILGAAEDRAALLDGGTTARLPVALARDVQGRAGESGAGVRRAGLPGEPALPPRYRGGGAAFSSSA